MNPAFSPEAAPGLEGPDYVALVIEWADDDDPGALPAASAPAAVSGVPTARKIAAVVGALGAIALTTWGLRRLRAVS